MHDTQGLEGLREESKREANPSVESSGQFRIIRSVRADVPMLDQQSSYENLSLQNSQDLVGGNKYNSGENAQKN